jgi:hypothetical protein
MTSWKSKHVALLYYITLYYIILYYIMLYDDIFNRNWVNTRWQQYIAHLHTTVHIIQRKEYWEVQAMPCLCELYPGICLTTEEKARKPLSYGSTIQEQWYFKLCWTYANTGVFYVYLRLRSTLYGDTQWRNCLRHCTTIRKVAGSIPDVVNGIFHWHKPSGRTMALWFTLPLTEMRTRDISWG